VRRVGASVTAIASADAMGGAPAAQSKQQSWPPDGALAGSPGVARRENMPWLPHASGMNLSALDMPARTDPLPASKCSSMANSPTTTSVPDVGASGREVGIRAWAAYTTASGRRPNLTLFNPSRP
jgi:hypothetical protein